MKTAIPAMKHKLPNFAGPYVQYSQYKVTYFFNHSKMGFSNRVTVMASSPEEAIENAKKAVGETYRADMLKRFTYKIQ